MNKIAALCFSGGMDSTSLLLRLIRKNYKIFTLSYDYGQKHKIEIQKAKDNKLQPSDWESNTFTISNLGMFGIESFTSIINQPNSAILSVGSIIQKPVVRKDKIVISNTMKLTLACDHRTIDGASGSKFLLTLKDFVENPIKLLL